VAEPSTVARAIANSGWAGFRKRPVARRAESAVELAVLETDRSVAAGGPETVLIVGGGVRTLRSQARDDERLPERDVADSHRALHLHASAGVGDHGQVARDHGERRVDT
jgi:hypothetical protein